MLPFALWLAAAPVYAEPSEPVAAPAEEEAAGPRLPYEQWGFTGNVGASIPLSARYGAGVRTSAGARYAMRPPPDADTPVGVRLPDPGVYVTPTIAFLATGSFASAGRSEPAQPRAPLSPVSQARPADETGSVGGDVRLELTVSRRGGMLMPDFSTWLSTGSEVVFEGANVAGIATHVGFGLGIDFLRDVAPTLAGWVFSPDAFASVFDFTVRAAINLAATGYGILVAVGALVFVPLVCVAGMSAIFLGGSAVSLTQVEVRYTVLASQRGLDGNAGLVIGIGI